LDFLNKKSFQEGFQFRLSQLLNHTQANSNVEVKNKMKKTLTILLAVASVLVVAAFVGVAFAQTVIQTPTATANNQIPPCIKGNNGANVPPSWSNSTNTATCNVNQYCQNQGCLGLNGQVQAGYGYGCGIGMQGRCR